MSFDRIAIDGAWHEKALFHTDDKAGLLSEWRSRHAISEPQLYDSVQGELPSAEILPQNSFLLTLDFTLATPYMSRDDTNLYVIDNPVRKEWVFKQPMIAATSWKGALRATAWQLGYTSENEPLVTRLFGTTRGEEGQRGALQFFPTLFQPSDLAVEIINPHERESGTGKNPIPFEVVRAGASGTFQLLYTPLVEQNIAVIATDLSHVVTLVQALLLDYGIGAKTSLGYGTARPFVSGELVVRADLPSIRSEQEKQASNLPRYLKAEYELIDDLRADDGTLASEDEYKRRLQQRGQKYGKRDRQLYAKASSWWVRELERRKSEPPPDKIEVVQQLATSYNFRGFDALRDIGAHVQTHWQEGR